MTDVKEMGAESKVVEEIIHAFITDKVLKYCEDMHVGGVGSKLK